MISTTKQWSLIVALLLVASACNTDGDDGTESPDDTASPTGSGATVPTDVAGSDSTAGTARTPSSTDTGAEDEPGSNAGTVASLTESVCVVLDAEGSDDPQNKSVILGARRAAEQFGIEVDVSDSPTAADTTASFESFVTSGCSLIVASGVRLADAAEAAANRYADQQFAIVDYDYPRRIDNMLELTFDVPESSFLAGYLAAGTTDTGIVATYAGINIEPFTLPMDGFATGVEYYNREAGTAVVVLGADDPGRRIVGTLDDPDVGVDVAADFAAQGADTIFPVAGAAGLGTARFAAESSAADPIRVIGFDHDLYEVDSSAAGVYLTSVVKNFDVAVIEAVERSIFLGEDGGKFVGTLENGGVDLAPFHEQSDLVSDELRDQLDELRVEVIAGNVSTR